VSPPIPKTPADRLLTGFGRLLDECNRRLLAELPSRVPPEQDPRFLLNYSLGFGSSGIRACGVLLDSSFPSHAFAVARPLIEHSSRVLWAARGRWSRYWAWTAQEYVKRHVKAAPYIGPVQKQIGTARFAAIQAMAAGLGMPDLSVVFEDLAADDAADPESPENQLGLVITPRDGREQYHMLFPLDLHLSAHGNPDTFLEHGEAPARLPWVLAYTAMMVSRACHIQCRWPQDPLFWAYTWITRGQRDARELSANRTGSYGDLGLSPL